MDLPKSTVKEPLKFFQWLFMEGNFHKYKKIFFEQILDNSQILDFKKDEISYWGVDNNGVDNHLTENFGNELHKVFKRELINAKRNMDDAINTMLLNGNLPGTFLSYIQETLKSVRTQSEKSLNYYPYHTEETFNLTIDDYPFMDETFKQLDNYIARKQSVFSSDTENFSEANVISIQAKTSNEEENNLDEYAVKEIFGYFKSRMNSVQEYDRLIDHITQFVETGNLPDEQQFQRFRHIHNIDNDEIRYTFYYLLCENKNKAKINRHQLCKFIIMTFDDFSNVAETTLYKKLSERPSLNEPYIPDFIKNHDLK